MTGQVRECVCVCVWVDVSVTSELILWWLWGPECHRRENCHAGGTPSHVRKCDKFVIQLLSLLALCRYMIMKTHTVP